MKKRLFLLPLPLLLILLSCGNKITSNQQNAQVRLVLGDVKVSLDNRQTWNTATKGEILNTGAVIRSAAKSTCDLLIGTSSLIRIKPDSELRLSDLFYDKNTGEEKTLLKLEQGKSLIKVRKLLKDGSSFHVETPTAVVGVRGTEFLVDVNRANDTLLAVNEGRVSIRAKLDAETQSNIPAEFKESVEKEITVEKDSASIIKAENLSKISEIVSDSGKEGKTPTAKDFASLLKKLDNNLKPVKMDLFARKAMSEFKEMDESFPLTETSEENDATTSKNQGDEKTTKETLKPGSKTWTFKASGSVKSDLCTENDRIFVSASDGLYGLDVKGNKAWFYTLASGTSSSPTITGNSVLISGNDGSLAALSKSDGQLLWKQNPGTLAYSKPASSAGKIYLGTSAGQFLCLNAETGEQIWTYKTTGGIYSTPCVTSSLVIFGSEDGSIIALDLAGSQKWATKTGGRIVKASPVASGNEIYCGSSDGYLYCLNGGDGSLKWKFQTAGKILTTPAFTDTALFIVSTDGNLYAINKANGSVLWQKTIGTKPESSAVVSKDTVYVASDAGKIFAYNANGNPVWQTDNAGKISGNIAISGDRLFAGSETGTIISIMR